MKKTTIEKAIDLLYNIQESLANKQIDDGESERTDEQIEEIQNTIYILEDLLTEAQL